MKKLLQLSAAFALALASVAFSPSAPGVSEDPSIELACKPRGTTCHTSFECCSQKCQPSNGVDVCH